MSAAWRAEIARSKGNDQFRAGRYEDAVASFSAAIKESERDHISYTNRCAAFMKLKRWQDAINDASMCITLKPEHAKSFSRRAQANFELGRYYPALEDIDRAILLDKKLQEKMLKLRADCEEAMANNQGSSSPAPPPATPAPLSSHSPTPIEVAISLAGQEESKPTHTSATQPVPSLTKEEPEQQSNKETETTSRPAFAVATPVPASSAPIPTPPLPTSLEPSPSHPGGNLTQEESDRIDYVSDDEDLLDETAPAERTSETLDAGIATVMGRTTENAANQLTSAIKTCPDKAKWYLSRGMIYHKLENYKEAVEDFTCAIDLGPSTGPDELVQMALLNRARVRVSMGDVKGAKQDADAAYGRALDAESRRECASEQARIRIKLVSLGDDSDKPEVTRYGGDRVIMDVTELEAKIESRKAAGVVEEAIASGRKQAQKGIAFRKRTQTSIAEFKAKVKKENAGRRERNARRAERREALEKKKQELEAAKREAAAAVVEKIPAQETAPVEEVAEVPPPAAVVSTPPPPPPSNVVAMEVEVEKLVEAAPEEAPIEIERISIPIRVIRRPSTLPTANGATTATSTSTSTTTNGTVHQGTAVVPLENGRGGAEEEDHVRRGVQLLSAKRYDEAIKVLTTAILAASVPHPLGYIKRAAAYVGKGAVESALADCAAAGRLMQPKEDWPGLWYELHVLRSKIYKDQGKIVDALDELEEATGLDLSTDQRIKVEKKVAELVEINFKMEQRQKAQRDAARKSKPAITASTGIASNGATSGKLSPKIANKKPLIEEIVDNNEKSDKISSSAAPSPSSSSSVPPAGDAASGSRGSSSTQGAPTTSKNNTFTSAEREEDRIAFNILKNVHLNAGEQAIRDKNWFLAETQYELALQYDPTCTEACVQLAAVFAEQSKWADSEKFATKALELDAQSPEARRYRATAYLKQKRHLEAFTDYVHLAEAFDDQDAASRARTLQSAMKAAGGIVAELPEKLRIAPSKPKSLPKATGSKGNAIPFAFPAVGPGGKAGAGGVGGRSGKAPVAGKATKLSSNKEEIDLSGFRDIGNGTLVDGDVFKMLEQIEFGAIDPRK